MNEKFSFKMGVRFAASLDMVKNFLDTEVHLISDRHQFLDSKLKSFIHKIHKLVFKTLPTCLALG